ncbi:MAG: patatin-like phospholipase family protein [Duodenibacillus sp.]|nr:patatin-like phospholipase family protein [Duodenibacillus sp.]
MPSRKLLRGASALAILIACAAAWASPKTGLVLSGGGARGFAHIGALRALEELRVPVHVVTATSMGALVGGAYSAGYSPQDLERITGECDWKKMFAMRPDRKDTTWRRKEDTMKGLLGLEVGVGKDGLTMGAQIVPTQEFEMFLGRVTEPVKSVSDLSELPVPFMAMATDLEHGQPVEMQKKVPLAVAMRASMSVPGAFAPVEHNGLILVDGGLVDNMPVQRALDQGAERVIAINVGTPIGGREECFSFLGVMGQMINLLTEQNVKVSISKLKKGRDVFITPELSDVSSADFAKSADIIERGYKAVMAHKDELRPFAVSQAEYEAWRLRYRKPIAQPDGAGHRISSVRVEGLKKVNPEAVEAMLDIDTSKPVSDAEIADNARRVWAEGSFGTVPYRLEPGPDHTETLVFTPWEKPWGYSTLRFGGTLETDFDSHNNFTVLLAHTLSWANAWGAEWRNEVQLGDRKKLMTEWHQPLGAGSQWYVRPNLTFATEPFDVYLDSKGKKPEGSFSVESVDASLAFGRDFGRWGTGSLMAGWSHSQIRRNSGILDGRGKVKTWYAGAAFAVDTLDDSGWPRKGYKGQIQVKRTFGHNDLGIPNEVVYEAAFLKPIALSKEWTLTLSANAGRSMLPGFTMGGVFNLSGSPYGRWNGNRSLMGQAMLYRALSPSLEMLGMQVYAGASFEIGRIYSSYDKKLSALEDPENSKRWRKGASLFLGADTWVGPIYLVAGRTFGYGNSLQFYWGHIH